MDEKKNPMTTSDKPPPQPEPQRDVRQIYYRSATEALERARTAQQDFNKSKLEFEEKFRAKRLALEQEMERMRQSLDQEEERMRQSLDQEESNERKLFDDEERSIARRIDHNQVAVDSMKNVLEGNTTTVLTGPLDLSLSASNVGDGTLDASTGNVDNLGGRVPGVDGGGSSGSGNSKSPSI